MVLIVLFQVGKILGPTPLPIPSSLLGYSLRIFVPVPTSLLGYSLRMPGPVLTSLLGYSLRMSGPVPSFGGSSPRQSLLFFPHNLYHFIVVQVNVEVIIIIIAVAVVLWGARGASAIALAAFGRRRATAAGLAEVSGPFEFMMPVGPTEVEAPDVPTGDELRVTAWVPSLPYVGGSCCLGCLGELPPFPSLLQQLLAKLSNVVIVVECPLLNLI